VEKNDVVIQLKMELKMKKLNLFAVKPSDTKKDVQKKLIEFPKEQGIKEVKKGKIKTIGEQ
tara:strand:+ start:593 stop:775 length:183 start_codon:yes stop_codon:yes gene_type:complete